MYHDIHSVYLFLIADTCQIIVHLLNIMFVLMLFISIVYVGKIDIWLKTTMLVYTRGYQSIVFNSIAGLDLI